MSINIYNMDTTKSTGKALKVIDIKTKSFTANGKTYHIEMDGLAISRLIMYQKLQIEVAYGVTFVQMYDAIKKCYELTNKQKFADVAVKQYNILEGIKTFENRRIPMLELCALFINEDKEDRGVISKEMIQAKVADWEAEGLDAIPFFQLAISSIQSFSQSYNEITQTISELQGVGK